MKPPKLSAPRSHTDLATGERIVDERPRGAWPVVRWCLFMVLVALVGWFAGITVAQFTSSGQTAKKSVYSAQIKPARNIGQYNPQTGEAIAVEPAVEKPDDAAEMAKKAFEGGANRKGELLLHAGSAEELDALIKQVQAAGGTVLGIIRGLNTVRVSFADADSMANFIRSARSSGLGGPNATSLPSEMTYNTVVSLPTPPPPPMDPYAPGSLVPFGTTALASIGVPADNANWGKGVTVAVLDAPVSKATQDMLTGANFRQIDLTDSSAGAEPGHGDLVVSLLAGTKGEQGMIPAATVLSIPVLNANGEGDVFSVANAIYEAVNQNARVINMSLGTEQSSQILQAAIDYATSQGVVIVAAAGNDGVGRVSYPAAYPNVVAVSAIDATGQRAVFSNYGDSIDLAAPGVGVTTSTGVGSNMWFSGTSTSAPLVTGTIVEVMSANTGLTGNQAVQVVKQNADYAGPVTGGGQNDFYGAGVVNTERALNSGNPFINDVAVADIYVNVTSMPKGTTAPTQIVIQNRGTAIMFSVQLQVNAAGQHYSQDFAALSAGQVAAMNVDLPLDLLTSANGVLVSASVSALATGDANPQNNSMSRVIRLVPASN